MVHQRQGLPLGLEARDDLAAVHAGLDDLEGDLALHGLGLLGQEDRAHAALAELLEEFVGADHRAGTCAQGWVSAGGTESGRWRFQKAARPLMLPEQPLEAFTQGRVAGAHPVEEGRTLGRHFLFQGLDEERLFLHGGHLDAVARVVLHLHATLGGEVRTKSGRKTGPGERRAARPESAAQAPASRDPDPCACAAPAAVVRTAAPTTPRGNPNPAVGTPADAPRAGVSALRPSGPGYAGYAPG